jgi:hypothetical protein
VRLATFFALTRAPANCYNCSVNDGPLKALFAP